MVLCKNKFLIFSILAFVAGLIFFYGTMPRTRNMVLNYQDKSEKVSLPLNKKGDDNQIYEIRGEIYRGFVWQKTININVNSDCLLSIFVNGKEVLQGEKCPNEPISLTLDKFLYYGKNNIDIKLKNNGDGIVLFFSGSFSDPIFLITSVFLMVLLLFFITFVLIKKFKWNSFLIFIFAAGLCLRLFYCFNNSPFQRDHDNFTITGHLGFIQYISDKFGLPDPFSGWEFHQAPFYYVVMAIFYKMSFALGLYNAIKIQQLINVLLFTVFIFYGILILKIFIKDKKQIIWPAALLIFWPSGVMHSSRISNDVMYYLFFTIGSYYLAKWYQKVKDLKLIKIFSLKFFKDLFLSALWGSLSVATKLNGIIFFGLFGLVLFLVFLFKRKECKCNFSEWMKLLGSKILILFFVFLVGCGIGFANKARVFKNYPDKNWFEFVRNINGLDSNLRVGNNFGNFLFFDTRSYFLEPFAKPWEDVGGRQFLMVYLLKSSILGEWSFDGEEIVNFTLGLNFCLFIMIIYFFIGIFSLTKNDLKKDIVILLGFVVCFLGLVFYRVKTPFACDQDFRFILPILIPFVYFVYFGIKKAKEKGLIILEYFGYLSIILFLVLTLLFFGFLFI